MHPVEVIVVDKRHATNKAGVERPLEVMIVRVVDSGAPCR
jgi:hypothetical protein